MKRKKAQPVFKPYVMGQPSLIPQDLAEIIPHDHVVRVIHETIENIDLGKLMERYKGGGTSSYHPRMMLKVLVYAYTQRIYSSRQIAKALRENIYFMWLSGHNRPDFRTVNDFRGKTLQGLIQEIFEAVLEVLAEAGYVNFKEYFIDGTTIEANARKSSYVWAKNAKRYQAQLSKKVEELLEEVERANEADDKKYGDKDLPEMGEDAKIDSKKIKKKIDELNERLRNMPEDKQVKKVVKKLEKEYLPRQEKYEEQERLLDGRSSYSKTDPDATFMRLKEDRNQAEPRPRPGYNVQTGTENQFVVGFSVHRRPGDMRCFKPHMETLKRYRAQLPQKIIGDAGYGSEENYEYLEQAQVESYLKYPGFDLRRPKRFRLEQFAYDAETDAFRCPEGRTMQYQYSREQRSESGFVGQADVYECVDCGGCALRAQCTRSQRNRQLEVNWNLVRLRSQVRESLQSEDGLRLRSRRGVEVESVFGNIKQNMGFRRFMLRGMEKVTIEWGLLCLAHNMKKLATFS